MKHIMIFSFRRPIRSSRRIPLFVAYLLFTIAAVGCGGDENDALSGTHDASTTAGRVGGGGSGGTDTGKAGGGGASTPPIDAAACEALIRLNSTQNLSTTSKCMCNKCLADLGRCLADSVCVSLLQCGNETGCGTICNTQNSSCSSKRNELMRKRGDDFVTITSPVVSCQESRCAADAGD
jgi:hypothetical protein